MLVETIVTFLFLYLFIRYMLRSATRGHWPNAIRLILIQIFHIKIHHITKTQLTEFLRSLGYLCIIGGITLFFCFGLPNTFDISFFVGSIISSIILNPMRDVGKAAGRLTIPSFISSGYQEFMRIQKKYYDIEHLLTYSMKQFGRIAIEDYARELEYESGITKYKDLFEKEIFRYAVGTQQIFLSPKNIHFFLSKYPNSIKKPVIRYITSTQNTLKPKSLELNIEDNFKNIREKKLRKTPLMFIGPPGTGKTHLATTLGTCLNVPTQILNLSIYQDVNGTYSYKYDNGNFGLFEDLTIGDLNSVNYQNRFVILDEVDKSLTLDNQGSFINKNGSSIYSILHQLLDTRITELSIKRYEGATIDISNLNLILIANETFTTVLGKEKGQALESRIKIVNFDDGFTWEKKKDIVTKQFELLSDVQTLSSRSAAQAQPDLEIIKNIIDYDHYTLKNKGVRILLNVINEYINHLLHSDILTDLLGNENNFDCEEIFQSYS